MTVHTFCDYEDVIRRVPQVAGALEPDAVLGYIIDAAADIADKTGVTTDSSNVNTARKFRKMNAIMASYEIANTLPHTLRARDLQTVHYPLPAWEKYMDEFWMEFMETPIKTHTIPLGTTTY